MTVIDAMEESRESLCNRCRIGMESVVINQYEVCPYMYCHNGKQCTKYEEIKKTGFQKKLQIQKEQSK